MPAAQPQHSGITWLLFALLTVFSWGVYGVFLHSGQMGMSDKTNGRYMAFLYVGIAYVIVAVLAPLVVLKLNGASLKFWAYPPKGLWWSLIAGTVGAVGAFGVLLAFGAAPKPSYIPVVMSIIFAGAPIVNAFVSMGMHRPEHGWDIKLPFWIGIVLAAAGGTLVTKYKPTPAVAKEPSAQVAPVTPGGQH